MIFSWFESVGSLPGAYCEGMTLGHLKDETVMRKT